MTESEGRRGFVFIGPATSGKTSVGENIYARLGANTAFVRGLEILPDQVSIYAAERRLIPDPHFIPALERRLGIIYQNQVVFENIPRTPQQARSLIDWAENASVSLDVIDLQLTLQQVLNRSSRRLVCAACNSSYHPELKPPRMGVVCDKDGVQLSFKPGDDPTYLSRQYGEYLSERDGILETLRRLCTAKIHEVDANQTVAEVTGNLISILRI